MNNPPQHSTPQSNSDTHRLEAFSDGVMAVIITIIVLEIKVPHGASLFDLRQVTPVFLAYLLSFTAIGTYWNNHHHAMRLVKHVNSQIMWANLHLLFWISLIPFATSWLGENYTFAWPTAVYGSLSLLIGFSFLLLAQAIARTHKLEPEIADLYVGNKKGLLTFALYSLAIVLAFASHWLSDALYVVVAIMWFLPDGRFEGKS